MADSAASGSTVVTDPDTSGRLDLRLAAITHIVTHVVSTTDGTASRTSILGSALGRAVHVNLPTVDVRVVARSVRIRVEVACAWPAPVAEVGARVRAALVTEVERLTGLQVRSADVVVHVLHPEDIDERRASTGRVA